MQRITKTGYGYKAMGQMNQTENRLAVTGGDKMVWLLWLVSTIQRIRSMSWISNCEIPTSQMLANPESHNPMIKDNKLCIPVLQTGHFRLHVYLLMKTMQVTI